MKIGEIVNYLKHPKNILLRLASKGLFPMKDATYLKAIYFKKMGYKPNLVNPQTFNEKLQWLKLNDRKSIYTKMVDKNEAKKYVADIVGEEYIVPTLGIWNKFEEIDFEKLPNQFVLKCTHDSGGLIIVRDKDKLDKEYAKDKIEGCLKRNFFYAGREWPYKNVVPQIIAEKYLQEEIVDYKFYCFNGVPQFLYISQGLEDHSTARISFLTMEWEFASFGRSDYREFSELPQKPQRYEEMVSIAEKLSKNIPFVRVDLYEIEEKVYFSELTFTPCSGMMPFNPPEADLEIGRLLELRI